jgi:uncharacterized protein YrrD
MQHSIHSLIGFTIRAQDGDLGKVLEFYFDDATWTIRYMVVETGNWLLNRRVLISVAALGKPEWWSHTFSVNLTCDQVRQSPDIDMERPVYRQHEIDLHKYYQWQQYWDIGYGGILGITPFPLLENSLPEEEQKAVTSDDSHLRSTRQVTGYHIHATDGGIGHVSDFIVDDEIWVVRFIVADTGNWLLEKKVLVSPQWIKEIHWADAMVYLDNPRGSVKNCPEYEPSTVEME